MGSVAVFTIRTVYGIDRLYPSNKLASFICDVAGQQTLTPGVRQLVEEYGIQVNAYDRWEKVHVDDSFS